MGKKNVTIAEHRTDRLRKVQKDTQSLGPLNKRFTKQQILEAIFNNYGVTTYICLELDCTQRQLLSVVGSDLDYKKALLDARESIVDLAERTIIDCLKSPDEKIRFEAARTTLRSLGRNRGWTENDRNVLKINVNQDDNSPEAKKQRILQVFNISQEVEQSIAKIDPAKAEAAQLAIDTLKDQNLQTVLGDDYKKAISPLNDTPSNKDVDMLGFSNPPPQENVIEVNINTTPKPSPAQTNLDDAIDVQPLDNNK